MQSRSTEQTAEHTLTSVYDWQAEADQLLVLGESRHERPVPDEALVGALEQRLVREAVAVIVDALHTVT